jgi:Domain of unknown function (DUF202)
MSREFASIYLDCSLPAGRQVKSVQNIHTMTNKQGPFMNVNESLLAWGPGFDRRRAAPKKTFLDWYFNGRASRAKPQAALARTTPMRIEPKTFFANERTFLSWLHMAITIGSIAAALLGFSGAIQGGSTSEKVRAPVAQTSRFRPRGTALEWRWQQCC